MKILVPHGITATGVGVRQRIASGHLRPSSPCCGHDMEWTEDYRVIFCANCDSDLTELSEKVEPYTIGNDVGATIAAKSLKEWLEGIFGTTVDVEVTE